jgi:spore coat polysaccharide biosynthesis protein SpsF (cytidylyltransferase family)
MIVNIFIQARMSSSRYPGKVLAPVSGIPLVKHIIDRVRKINNKDKIVVLTSAQTSDDPLAAFLTSINCLVYRGSLDDVFDRFQKALDEYPCDYFVRLCADSPFIDTCLVQLLIEKTVSTGSDFISNVFLRTFPKGQSVEIIKSDLFKKISNDMLDDYEHEHVMPYFYKNKNQYKSLFFGLSKDLSHVSQCIDTVEDLKNIESKKPEYFFNEKELCLLSV